MDAGDPGPGARMTEPWCDVARARWPASWSRLPSWSRRCWRRPLERLAQDASPTPFAAAPGAVTLVAYSDAARGLRGDHPALPGHRGRRGHRVRAVLQRLGRPEPRRGGRPAGRPRGPLAVAGRGAARGAGHRRRPTGTRTSYKGIVHDSVVVFVVRPGNPKGITDWADLVREDVDVITPNPFTSGGAQWNLLAAYQAQIEAGKTEEEALDYLKQLIANTSVMDRSARESLATFMAGPGRRHDRLRERGHLRAADGPAHRVRHPRRPRRCSSRTPWP